MLCEGFGEITPPPAEGSAGTFFDSLDSEGLVRHSRGT